jgi:hypothetical protein
MQPIREMKRPGIAAFLIAAAAACISLRGTSLLAHAQDAPQSMQWQRIGTDLERADFTFSDGALFTSSITLVRSNLEKYKLRTIRADEFGWKRTDIRTLCRASGASVCINANFFDEQGKALGLVISRGLINQKIHKGGDTLTAILYATPNTTKIVHRDAFSGGGAIEAVQAGPRLVYAGHPIQGLRDSALASNLSGACIDTQGRFVVFRVTTGVFGGSITKLQDILLHPSIGCSEAINFDGGGSSQLYIGSSLAGNPDRTKEDFLAGQDTVPVAIGLFETGR